MIKKFKKLIEFICLSFVVLLLLMVKLLKYRQRVIVSQHIITIQVFQVIKIRVFNLNSQIKD